MVPQSPSTCRDAKGHFLPGNRENPGGQPRGLTEYLRVTMQTVTTERWAEIVKLAVADALSPHLRVRDRGRAFLAKVLRLDTIEVNVNGALDVTSRNFTVELTKTVIEAMPTTSKRDLLAALEAQIAGAPPPSSAETPPA